MSWSDSNFLGEVLDLKREIRRDDIRGLAESPKGTYDGKFQSLFHLFRSQWGVSFDEDVIVFAILERGQRRVKKNDWVPTDLDELGLRIPVVKFHLVDGGADTDIGLGEVPKPANIETITVDTSAKAN